MKKMILTLSALVMGCIFSPGDKAADTKLVINEIMVSNRKIDADTLILDADGNASDWIELYNRGKKPISLRGMGLSDDGDGPRFVCGIDTMLQPGAYFLFWGGTGIVNPGVHLGFSFSTDAVKKEGAFLYDAEGRLIDKIEHHAIPEARETNKSYGRSPDGEDTWQQQARPSPGGPNEM